MLSAYQMSAHQDWFTETALNLLINQVHEIWQDEDHVVSLLSLNITEISSVFHSLFILHDETSESMQQHQQSAECKYLCEWYHTANLQTNYWEKLSDS